jgi:hypothetical protein
MTGWQDSWVEVLRRVAPQDDKRFLVVAQAEGFVGLGVGPSLRSGHYRLKPILRAVVVLIGVEVKFKPRV